MISLVFGLICGSAFAQSTSSSSVNSLNQKEEIPSDTVVLDDANPTELEHFMRDKGADILVGGVKERPLAYKLGVAFLDHNHERKHPLCGFEGAINFAKETYASITSPVWDIVREYKQEVGD